MNRIQPVAGVPGLLQRFNLVLLTGLIALAYLASARLGLLLALEQANTSPVWPPTGVAIAAALYCGCRAAPGIFLGAFLAHLSAGTPLLAALAIAGGNTLAAGIACQLIHRLAGDYPFRTVLHSVVFVVSVALATMASATVGVATLVQAGLVGSDQFSALWPTWWIGDAVGGLVIAPLLLSWLHERGRWGVRNRELALLVALLLLLGAVAFSDLLLSIDNYPLAFLFLPLMFWGALRFGLRGLTSLVTLVSALAIFGTANGHGPFAVASLYDSLLLLQSFIATVVLACLVVAASREERQSAHMQLQEARRNLEQGVRQRTRALAQSNEALREEVSQRESTTEALKALLSATVVSDHDEFLRTSVRSLAEIYGTRYAFYGLFTDESRTRIKTLAVWANDGFAENFECDVAGTPCEDVLHVGITLVTDGAGESYPGGPLLREMEVESYYGAPLMASDESAIGIVAVMHDEPMQVEDWVKPVLGILANRIAVELRRKADDNEIRLAESVFNDNIEAIVITDARGRILRVNPAFTRLTGYSPEDALGETYKLIRSDQHDEAFYRDIWRDFMRDDYWQGEVWYRHRSGATFPVWQSVSMVRNAAGKPSQFISIFSDISEKKKSEEQIYQLAHYDPLTDLPNRASFQAQLEKALVAAHRHGYRLALIFFDIDNFKLINDTSGHQAGDLLLMAVARRLKSIIRKEDTVSRLGGDEFTVLLNDIHSSDDAVAVAKKILTDLAEPIRLEQGEVHITVSIGISTFPDDGPDADSLLKHADAAMYRAKEQGRNNFQFFTGEMHTRAIERLNLDKAMRRALDRQEFVVYYQPQVDAFSGRINGCEALVRWRHPERGLIQPGRFIPIAEENGIVVALGEWVMHEAFRQYREWSDLGIAPASIAINISGRQLRGRRLVPVLRRALDESGIEPAHVELELTESMFMEHVDDTIETLQELRAMGVTLSIDDFGTGYSSMAYLKRFPINKLKIDRSFVDDLATNADDAAIVSATVAMGHSLNLGITAEGVETSKQLEFLRAQGCDEVQGYYFSHPLPGHELVGLLSAGKLSPDGVIDVSPMESRVATP